MIQTDGVTSQLINKITLTLIVVWTVVIVVIALLHVYGNRKLVLNSALVEARTLVNQEELNRLWIADKGGLYVAQAGKVKHSGQLPKTIDSQSGTTVGNNFALVSHIEITRQMYLQLEEESGYRARMVRLDSVRSEGVPDEWERAALQTLTLENDSFYEITSSGDHDSLRLLQATHISEKCVACHPGVYQVGDLFGGFSLSIPLGPYFAVLGTYSYAVLVGYLVIWLTGIILTRFAARLFQRQLNLASEQESQLQLVETNLHYISYFDPGTNLPNRVTFDDRLRVAMAHATRLQERIAIAVVNIDNFTQIRDLFSQGVEDQLLQKVAEVIALKIRPDDTIARMGNDRLLLLLPGLVSRENVARIVNNINEAFETPVILDGAEILVRISFGVSVFPEDASESGLLVSYAETAASRVTQQKISNLQMYSQELNAAAHAHLLLETGLRQGLNRNEFCVYYQPQIDAPSGTIVGAEALIRWNHPSRGLIPPDQFIPMAENNGAIVPIGEWVLLDACKQAVHWRDTFNMPFRVGVNFSARQFQDIALVDVIDRALTETGIDPEDLEIEVTEGTIMEDVDKAIETLVDLKVRGIKVAIDDFGIGYSSLSQLKKLPFDRLKVDRSFISDLDNDRESQVIVEMIIDLAAKLNMEIIAEGVETEDQKKFLISRGCYPMQGYYFAKPMPAEDFTRFLGESRH